MMLGRPFEWLSRMMKRQIEFAPDDVDYCESECRKPQCSNNDWKNCERRTQHTMSCAAARNHETVADERPSLS